MFKLAVIVLLIGAAAASGITTLPALPYPAVSAVIPAAKAIVPGVIGGIAPIYNGAAGNVLDGIDSLGLAYNNYDLADGRVLGLGVGHLGYGLGGLGYGIGGLGLGRLGGLGLGGVKLVYK